MNRQLGGKNLFRVPRPTQAQTPDPRLFSLKKKSKNKKKKR